MSTNYKADFPLLAQRDVAYLDSAATAQRPQCVLDAEREFYTRHNANPLRGLYPHDLSFLADALVEQRGQTEADQQGEQDADYTDHGAIFQKTHTGISSLISCWVGKSGHYARTDLALLLRFNRGRRMAAAVRGRVTPTMVSTVFLVTWNFFIAVNLQNSIVRQSRWIKMVPAVAPPVSLRVADDE